MQHAAVALLALTNFGPRAEAPPAPRPTSAYVGDACEPAGSDASWMRLLPDGLLPATASTASPVAAGSPSGQFPVSGLFSTASSSSSSSASPTDTAATSPSQNYVPPASPRTDRPRANPWRNYAPPTAGYAPGSGLATRPPGRGRGAGFPRRGDRASRDSHHCAACRHRFEDGLDRDLVAVGRSRQYCPFCPVGALCLACAEDHQCRTAPTLRAMAQWAARGRWPPPLGCAALGCHCTRAVDPVLLFPDNPPPRSALPRLLVTMACVGCAGVGNAHRALHRGPPECSVLGCLGTAWPATPSMRCPTHERVLSAASRYAPPSLCLVGSSFCLLGGLQLSRRRSDRSR